MRSLYFLLANLARRFVYLQPGLALVLVFVGVKMAARDLFHLPGRAVAAGGRAADRRVDRGVDDQDPPGARRAGEGERNYGTRGRRKRPSVTA